MRGLSFIVLGRTFRSAVKATVCLLLISSFGRVLAATFVVDNDLDIVDFTPGDGICKVAAFDLCTLRAAVMEANALAGPDSIQLPSGLFVLSHHGADEDGAITGDLDITDDVVIFGVFGATFVDGDNMDRVFDIHSNTNVTLSQLVIQNGAPPSGDGGGVNNGGDELLLWDSIVQDNQAPSRGGGVYSNGVLEIENSAIRRNRANDGGGILVEGQTTIFETTISRNSAVNNSGGIGSRAFGDLTISNSTISQNRAPTAAALTSAWSLRTLHVTISDNVAADGVDIDQSPNPSGFVAYATLIDGTCLNGLNTTVTSYGGNLESPGDTCGLSPATDLLNVAITDLALSGLATLAGATGEAQLPEPGSVAIDAIPGCPSDFDQRRLPRPVDGDGVGGAACDIGAVEARLGENLTIFRDGFNGLTWPTD